MTLMISTEESSITPQALAFHAIDESMEETSQQQVAAPLVQLPQQQHPSLLLSEPTTFQVTKRLGSGGQAQVYQAEQLAQVNSNSQQMQQLQASTGNEENAQLLPDGRFALKVFFDGINHNIQQEASVHEQLKDHPHILKMHGYSVKTSTVKVPRNIPRDDNDSWAKWRQGCETENHQSTMVLDECLHGDFFEFIVKNGAIKDQKLLKFLFIQVCQGIGALHTQARMAHLDIKLENILVNAEGQLKICDFGMVQSVDAEIFKQQGTQGWMAPEIHKLKHICRDQEGYDGVPADIFSLGVLLFIMHYGQPPFTSSTSSDRNFTILQRNPEAFWRVHPTVKKAAQPIDEDLKVLLTSMLKQEPSKRPESIENLLSHPFFTKEDQLLNSQTNEWIDNEALNAQFRGKLVPVQQNQTAATKDQAATTED